MVTWWDGWKRLAVKVMTMTLPKDKFVERIAAEKPLRIPGTGVFLSTFHKEVPPMLLHYVNQTRAVHEKVVILSVLTADVPEVEPSKRVEAHGLGHGVYRVTGHYGFMETPDVPQILVQSRAHGVDIDLDNVTYYMGRITLVPAWKKTLPKWRRFLVHLYAAECGQPRHLFGHPAVQGHRDRRPDGVLRWINRVQPVQCAKVGGILAKPAKTCKD